MGTACAHRAGLSALCCCHRAGQPLSHPEPGATSTGTLWLVPIVGNKTGAASVRAGSARCGPGLSLSPAVSGIFPNTPIPPQGLLLKPRGHCPHLAIGATCPGCSWHCAQVPPLLENPGGDFSTRLRFPGTCCRCHCWVCALHVWPTERSPCCALGAVPRAAASCCHLRRQEQELGPHTPPPLQ